MSDLQFEYFDRFVPEYDDQRIQFVIDEIRRSDYDGKSLLDVGCGNGSILLHLSSSLPGMNSEGFDPSLSYVERAQENGVAARLGSVLDADSFQSSYDYIVMASVLHHLVDFKHVGSRRNAHRALVCCLEHLNPGGRLFIFEPCFEPSWLTRCAYEVKKIVIRLGGNRRIGFRLLNVGAPLVAFFSRADLRSHVESSGGLIEAIVDVDSSPFLKVLHRHGTGLVVSRNNIE